MLYLVICEQLIGTRFFLSNPSIKFLLTLFRLFYVMYVCLTESISISFIIIVFSLFIVLTVVVKRYSLKCFKLVPSLTLTTVKFYKLCNHFLDFLFNFVSFLFGSLFCAFFVSATFYFEVFLYFCSFVSFAVSFF